MQQTINVQTYMYTTISTNTNYIVLCVQVWYLTGWHTHTNMIANITVKG